MNTIVNMNIKTLVNMNSINLINKNTINLVNMITMSKDKRHESKITIPLVNCF